MEMRIDVDTIERLQSHMNNGGGGGGGDDDHHHHHHQVGKAPSRPASSSPIATANVLPSLPASPQQHGGSAAPASPPTMASALPPAARSFWSTFSAGVSRST
jgi:hypothetical protein